MKAIAKIAAMLLMLSTLSSCSDDTPKSDDNGAKMRATIIAIAEKIEVEVIDGDYGASGIYWVIIGDNAIITDSDGSKITVDSLKPGDKVEILYSGQVMMSYPPQIVAKKIAKL